MNYDVYSKKLWRSVNDKWQGRIQGCCNKIVAALTKERSQPSLMIGLYVAGTWHYLGGAALSSPTLLLESSRISFRVFSRDKITQNGKKKEEGEEEEEEKKKQKKKKRKKRTRKRRRKRRRRRRRSRRRRRRGGRRRRSQVFASDLSQTEQRFTLKLDYKLKSHDRFETTLTRLLHL